MIEPMVFIDYPKEGIAFLVGFGMVLQYPSKFQYICNGAQKIFYIPLKKYYTCIQYFWAQAKPFQ
jgi:hypothetical protein